MDNPQKPLDRLISLMRSVGVAEVAKGSGLTENYLRRIIKGEAPGAKNPTIDTFQAILEKGCNRTLGQFFREVAPDTPGDTELWEMFRDSLLDPRRRGPVEGLIRALHVVAQRDREEAEKTEAQQTPSETLRSLDDRAS